MEHTEADIRIHFRKTARGYLATVSLVTSDDVQFHRVQLDEDAPIWMLHDAIVGSALERLRARYGPSEESPRVVSMQMALPHEY